MLDPITTICLYLLVGIGVTSIIGDLVALIDDPFTARETVLTVVIWPLVLFWCLYMATTGDYDDGEW